MNGRLIVWPTECLFSSLYPNELYYIIMFSDLKQKCPIYSEYSPESSQCQLECLSQFMYVERLHTLHPIFGLSWTIGTEYEFWKWAYFPCNDAFILHIDLNQHPPRYWEAGWYIWSLDLQLTAVMCGISRLTSRPRKSPNIYWGL